MPAVSRISSIHCWPSTSTCCKRKKTTKQNKGSVTQMMQGFNFRSASTSVKKTRKYVERENRGREEGGEIDRHGEVKTKASKAWTHRVDERRVKLLTTSSSHPDSPPSGGRSPFCTSLLLWGRTFPQRSPEQTEPSVRRGQRQQAGQHRIGSAEEEQNGPS